MTDGRNISADLGTSAGEGAGQKTSEERSPSHDALPGGVWQGAPPAATGQSPTYYDRPLLKEPVWIWAVPAYFFCGGAAGAAAVLGEAARMLDPDEMRTLSTRCRWIAAAGTSAGGALLIYDLGRPARFFNMLRVFRPTSAMSMGSWILAAAGGSSGLAAALSTPARTRLTKGARPGSIAAQAAGAASALLGLPLAAYTAVLLSDTAVPLWQQVRKTLPALFVSSAAASAAALLKLCPGNPASERVVRHYGIIGTAAEIVCAHAVEKQARQVERVGRPLEQGLAGYLWKVSKVLAAANLALGLTGEGSRSRRIASGLCGVAGGLALRFSIFHAGKLSARDPRASFELQRSQQQSEHVDPGW